MIKLSLKIILFLLSINTFLNAESILKLTNNQGNSIEYCIEDNYYYRDNRFWFQKVENSFHQYFELDNPIIAAYEIKKGYINENNSCILDESSSGSEHTVDTTLPLTYENLTVLGLSQEDLHYMFALSGITTSFLFLFGLFRWI